MKKLISLGLVGVMALSMIPTTMAIVLQPEETPTTNYTNGTQVQYNAEADNDGDGQPDHSESWTVTVPALLAPGETGTVKASGTWASNRKLVVTSEQEVYIQNSINQADYKNLDVTFNGIELLGDNTKSVMKEESVGIENITNALFGTWSGTFYYDVELMDADVITFLIGEDVFKTKSGMTWAEWCDSEYNTRRFEVSNSGSVYIKNEGALKTSDMESVKGNEVIDTSKTYVMDYYPM